MLFVFRSGNKQKNKKIQEDRQIDGEQKGKDGYLITESMVQNVSYDKHRAGNVTDAKQDICLSFCP